MLEQRIQQQFFEGADLHYQAAEALSRPVAAAAQVMLTAIIGGGKVLTCGAGLGRTVARHLAEALVGRLERDRPSLAALWLPDDPSRLDGASAAQEIFARPLRALAQPGDVLVVVDHPGSPATQAAVDAAHEKDASVVVLAAAGSTPAWSAKLHDTDVIITVPHERAARIAEMHLLVAHCLCDALDLQLLGEPDT